MESIIHLKDLELERRGQLHSHHDSQRLLQRFNGRCSFCDLPFDQLTLDHLIPRSKGGSSESYNLFPACKECNCSKGDKYFLDWYVRHWSYDSERQDLILEIHNDEYNRPYTNTDYQSLHEQWVYKTQRLVL